MYSANVFDKKKETGIVIKAGLLKSMSTKVYFLTYII